MKYNPEIHHRKSYRLKDYDYSQQGMYYVTICTKNREHFFGLIKDSKMILSESGLSADKYWREIPDHFPFATLDEFIIMPNHIHGIIKIKNKIESSVGSTDGASFVRALQCNALTNDAHTKDARMSEISPKKGTLSVIIRSYKSACTKTINERDSIINFAWQSRYYDHIIRNEYDLNRIREYIRNNPVKWGEEEDLDNYGVDFD
jgi:putative transposase